MRVYALSLDVWVKGKTEEEARRFLARWLNMISFHCEHVFEPSDFAPHGHMASFHYDVEDDTPSVTILK